MKQHVLLLLLLTAAFASPRAAAQGAVVPTAVVTVKATDPTASEAGSGGLFTFYRSGPTNQSLAIRLEYSGTAGSARDYAPLQPMIAFPPGRTEVSMQVNPLNDQILEPTETVIVKILGPLLGAPAQYAVGSPSTATVTILDDDRENTTKPTVWITAKDAMASETGNNPASFEISRIGSTNQDLRVDLVTEIRSVSYSVGSTTRIVPPATSGVDFVPLTNNVVIPAGRTSVVLSVTPKDDTVAEGLENVTLAIAQSSRYNLNPPADRASVFIDDNEVGPLSEPIINISASPARLNETSLEPGAFIFTRSGSIEFPIDVQFRVTGSAQSGIDYQQISNHIVMPAGAATARILIRPVPDKALESDETIIITLSTSDCSEKIPPPLDCYKIGPTNKATMTIAEVRNLPPQVAIKSPLDHSRFTAPATIQVEAAASDPDGSIAQLSVYAGDRLVGVEKTATLSVPWSNVSTGSYVLRAIAIDNTGLISTSALVHVTVTAPTNPPVSIHVNFQPTNSPVPPGYIADYGREFGPRDVGPAFGWVWDNRANMVARNLPESPDTRYDTFAFMQREGASNVWQIALSNGVYRVHAVAGDAHFADGFYDIVANGVTLLAGARSRDQLWIEGTMDVPVTNGRLTIANGPRADKNKICFIDITSGGAAGTNKPPTVSISEPRSGAVYNAHANIGIVALANDTDGFVRTVEFLQGTTRIGIATNNPNSANPANPFHITWTNVAAGTYTLRARATDNLGASTLSEPATITVTGGTDTGPVVKIVDPAPNATFPAPAAFKVLITASDPRGYIIQGALFVDDKLAATEARNYLVAPPAGQPAEFIFIVTNLPAGNHVLTAQARNDRGISASSAPVPIVVKSNPTPPGPRVQIRQPLDGTVVAPGNIPFNVLASDENGYITEASLFRDGTLVAKSTRVYIMMPMPGTPAEFSLVASNTPPGTYAFMAQAKNDRGIVGSSSPIKVTVQGAANVAPIVAIQSPGSGAQFPAGTNVSVRVSASDRDGTISQVQMLVDGAVVASTDRLSDGMYGFTMLDLKLGGHVLQATARDNGGLVTTSGPVAIQMVQSLGQNVVNVRALLLDVSEGATGTFRISRSGSLQFGLPVSFSLGGTALNGLDYLRVSTSAVIPAGSESVDVKIVTTEDHIVEGTESVTLTIEPPICPAIFPPPPSCYLVGGTNQAKILIKDPTAANALPHVSMASPTNGFTAISPANIVLRAEASDTDGTISKVEFLVGTTVVGVDTTAPYSVIWTNREAGTFGISARATDNGNGVTTSTPVVITLKTLGLAAASVEPVGAQFLPGGVAQITLPGAAGHVYLLEASSDFSDWESLGSARFESDTFTFLDASPGQNRFYRAVFVE